MAATDRFAARGPNHDPALHAASVTPSDSGEMTYASRALWVGGAGDVRVQMGGGETVTVVGVVAGTLLPIRVRQVLSTGTTATDIVSFW